MSKIKGQNFRLLVNSAVVPESTSCSVSITGNTEDSSTKDDTGMWTKETIVSTSWSASVDSYNAETEALCDLVTLFNAGQPIPVGWDQTSGANNATAANASFKRSGNALLNDLSIQFNDRTNITVTSQYQGTGALS